MLSGPSKSAILGLICDQHLEADAAPKDALLSPPTLEGAQMFKAISNPPLLHTTITNTVTTLAQIRNGPNDHDFCFVGDFG